MTNYYPPGPIYVASYEKEDVPTLVNNLIPRPTSEENTNKMEESKTAEDKRNRIEIKYKEDELSQIGIQTILITKNIKENSKELIISNLVYCMKKVQVFLGCMLAIFCSPLGPSLVFNSMSSVFNRLSLVFKSTSLVF